MPVIQREGVSTYFSDHGSGPPVVLMHSFLCNGDMWAPVLPMLAREHHIINVDFRGHGKSGNIQANFSIYDLVEDVIAVLDALNIQQAVFAGLSIGGMVALRAALTHPQRVSGLIILDSHAGAERLPIQIKYRAMGVGSRVFGFKPFLPTVLALMFGPTTRARNSSLVMEWKARFALLDVPSILCGLHALITRDSIVDRLSEIKTPALVMAGEEDAALPIALSQEIADGLPEAQFVAVPEAGHLVTLEQPKAVSDAMLAYLAG